MSESQEYRLANTLVWSQQDFSLAEFVNQYQLPQVVLVEVGYCSADERTTFSSGQILTLHALHTTNKIVCQLPHSNAVVVHTSCPLKAEVIPMDCRDTIVTAYQLSTIYQDVEYVRVMEVGSTWNNKSLATLKMNDILKIKCIDNKNSVIRCKNLTTAQDVAILIDSTAVFVPLLDSKTYTLAEVQKKFGLPAKVRFLDKRAEIQMRHTIPGTRNPWASSTYLTNLGQLTAIEEIQESEVIVTTVCSDLKEKVCLNVPTTLDIRVTVAEGFLKGDETYQKVVKTLDRQLNRTNLKAFDDLDVYQHMDAVKKTMEDLTKDLSVEDASRDVLEHARERLERVERQKSMKAHSFERPPKLQPRGVQIKPPPRPPKRAQKPDQKQKQKPDPQPRKNPGTLLKKWVRRQSSNTNTTNPTSPTSPVSPTSTASSTSDDFSSGEENYEEPFQRADGVYASVEENYERPTSTGSDDSNNSNEYTELDSEYIKSSQKPYGKLLGNLPRKEQKSSIQDMPLPELPTQTRILPPLPTSQPPQDKQLIYEAISRYPQDLSSLSVADVKKLLVYLGMSAYVEKFENELIDGTMLMTLDQESLDSLDIQTFHSKKLLRFIGGWRPNV